MTWFLAPSLVALRDEINRRWPGRDKASDGSVGDTSHAARVSSHNPLWSAPGKWSGVVRAIDVDSNGSPGARTPIVNAVLDAAIGDHRVWYVIWNRTIWSRTYNWAPQPYNGEDPHDKHVHVSLQETIDAWSDTERWLDQPKAPAPTFPKAPTGDIAVWNCKVGDREHFVRELDTLRGKKVIGLLETGGHRGDIHRWAARHGYTKIVTGEGDVGASSMLLIHKSIAVQHSGVLVSRVKWKGPKGKTIDGRAFPWARIVLDGRVLDVVVVHMPWNPMRNVRAWISCSSLIRKFAFSHPGADQLYVGDFNQRTSVRSLWSIWRTVRRIGGRIVATGAALDYAILRPAKRPAGRPVRPVVVSGHKGARLGSDHHVVTYEIGAAA